MDVFEVVFAIKDGKRLEIPENSCPPSVSKLIYYCWETNPNERPDFETIGKMLCEPQLQQ